MGLKAAGAMKGKEAFLRLLLQPNKKAGKAAPGDDEDNDQNAYQNIQSKLNSVPDPKRRTQKLRYLLQARQIKNPVWTFAFKTWDGKVFENEEGDPKLSLPVPPDTKLKYFQALVSVLQEKPETKDFGWMGELPIHCLFLLAYREPVDDESKAKTEILLFLGKLLARMQPSLASTGYCNEIRLYKERERMINKEGNESTETTMERNERVDEDEMGMYTGETVLHIAIMNNDVAMVKYLLNHLHSDFSKRAVGAFFRPSIINRLRDDPKPNPAQFDERGATSDRDKTNTPSISSSLLPSSPRRMFDSRHPVTRDDSKMILRGGGGGGAGSDLGSQGSSIAPATLPSSSSDGFSRVASADAVLSKGSAKAHPPLRKTGSELSGKAKSQKSDASAGSSHTSEDDQARFVIEACFGVGESGSSTDFSGGEHAGRKSSIETNEDPHLPLPKKSRWQKRWEWLRAAIEDRDLKAQPFIEVNVNQDSAFFSFHRPELYFGEYPLSFAVYTGNQDVCEALYQTYKDKWKQKGTHKVESIFKQRDLQGNTAFHMAVLHDKKDIFDWLKRVEDTDDAERAEHEEKKRGHHGAQAEPFKDFDDNQPHHAHAHGASPHTPPHNAAASQEPKELSKGLETLNIDGLTPFTLAARHGRQAMFDHMLETHMADVMWVYGGLKMIKTSLLQMDTFRIKDNKLHKEARWRSALEVIVQHEVETFCQHALFNKLIEDKWITFGRRHYLLHTLLPYLIFIGLFTTMVILRCEEVRVDWQAVREGRRGMDEEGIVDYLATIDSSFVETSVKVNATRICEGACLLSCIVLLWEGWRNRRLNATDIDPDGDKSFSMSKFGMALHKNLSFLLYAGIAGAVSASIAHRVVGYVRTELCLLAVACVLVFCNLLHIVMPLKMVGVLVIMVYRIFIKDVLLCLFVYSILLCAFSMAIFVMFQKSDFPKELNANRMDFEAFPGASFLQLAWNSLGDGYVDMNLLIQNSQTPSLALVLQLVWVVLSEVLLLNLLIAMMSRTFDDDNRDAHRIWIFPFAHQVLRYEKRLSYKSKGRHRSGKSKHTDNDFLKDEDRHTEIYYDPKLQDLRGNDAASEEKPKAEPSEPQHNEPAVAPVTAPSAEIGDNGALHSPAPSSVAQYHGGAGWGALSHKAEHQLHEDLQSVEQKLSLLEQTLDGFDKVEQSQKELEKWTKREVEQCRERLEGALVPLGSGVERCREGVQRLGKERGRLENRIKALARARTPAPLPLAPLNARPVTPSNLPLRQHSLPLSAGFPSPSAGDEMGGADFFRQKARERLLALDVRVRGGGGGGEGSRSRLGS